MRTVKVSPIEGSTVYQEVTIAEMVEQLPSFMLAIAGAAAFPPLLVLNDLFSKEKLDDGMSGGICWEAFELSEYERGNLMESLSEKYQINFEVNNELDELATYSDWAKRVLKYCGLKR